MTITDKHCWFCGADEAEREFLVDGAPRSVRIPAQIYNNSGERVGDMTAFGHVTPSICNQCAGIAAETILEARRQKNAPARREGGGAI